MEDVNLAYAAPTLSAAARNCRHLSADDALSEAHLAYVRAQRRHDPARGTFARHLSWRVKKALQQAVRDDIRQRRGLRADKSSTVLNAVPLTDVHPAPPGDWTAELSEDAAAVVRLALCHEGRPQSIRALLKRELADLGWAASKIVETFKEIAECLP